MASILMDVFAPPQLASYPYEDSNLSRHGKKNQPEFTLAPIPTYRPISMHYNSYRVKSFQETWRFQPRHLSLLSVSVSPIHNFVAAVSLADSSITSMVLTSPLVSSASRMTAPSPSLYQIHQTAKRTLGILGP